MFCDFKFEKKENNHSTQRLMRPTMRLKELAVAALMINN